MRLNAQLRKRYGADLSHPSQASLRPFASTGGSSSNLQDKLRQMESQVAAISKKHPEIVGGLDHLAAAADACAGDSGALCGLLDACPTLCSCVCIL